MKRLTCTERDALLLDPQTRLVSDDWGVESSLTDPSSEFGEPRIETTWGRGSTRVRDVRHPGPDDGLGDVRPCEHWQWTEEEGGE